MALYENVKTRAIQAGKSISAIESEAGIANGTIGQWRTAKPYAETVQKVAKVLDCSMEDLLAEQVIN